MKATLWTEHMGSNLCYFCHHSPLSMNWLKTGCLIYGWISDNYGRYPTFLVSNVIVACSGITLPYCQDFHTFAAVRFIMGLNFTTFFTSIYVLGKETVIVLKCRGRRGKHDTLLVTLRIQDDWNQSFSHKSKWVFCTSLGTWDTKGNFQFVGMLIFNQPWQSIRVNPPRK